MAENARFVELFGKARRKSFESEGREENPSRVRRVAVGILSATRRNDDRLIEITFPVEEPDEDIRAVNLRVDIERGVLAGAGPLAWMARLCH